jgi:hypothetical protein
LRAGIDEVKVVRGEGSKMVLLVAVCLVISSPARINHQSSSTDLVKGMMRRAWAVSTHPTGCAHPQARCPPRQPTTGAQTTRPANTALRFLHLSQPAISTDTSKAAFLSALKMLTRHRCATDPGHDRARLRKSTRGWWCSA